MSNTFALFELDFAPTFQIGQGFDYYITKELVNDKKIQKILIIIKIKDIMSVQ